MAGGKIVPFGRTRPDVARRMLEVAGVTRESVVLDLGSGDGSIILEAAKTFGAKSVGIEIDRELANLSLKKADALGVRKSVTVITGDFTKVKIPKSDIVTLYLLPSANRVVANRLLFYLPDSKVVAHRFPIPGWKPVLVEEYKGVPLYLYIPRKSALVSIETIRLSQMSKLSKKHSIT